MSEQMAIIRKPGFGMRDMNEPGLWFDIYTSDNSAALQVFHGDAALDVIRAYGVYDVKDLEGKPCLVEAAHGMMRYVRAMKAGA